MRLTAQDRPLSKFLPQVINLKVLTGSYTRPRKVAVARSAVVVAVADDALANPKAEKAAAAAEKLAAKSVKQAAAAEKRFVQLVRNWFPGLEENGVTRATMRRTHTMETVTSASDSQLLTE